MEFLKKEIIQIFTIICWLKYIVTEIYLNQFVQDWLIRIKDTS